MPEGQEQLAPVPPSAEQPKPDQIPAAAPPEEPTAPATPETTPTPTAPAAPVEGNTGQPKGEVGSAPEYEKNPKNPEQIAKWAREQPVARLAASTADPEAANPDHVFPQDEAEHVGQEAAQNGPDQLPTATIAQDSLDARKAEPQQKIENWRQGVANWIGEHTGADAADRGAVLATLSSLGINVDQPDKPLDAQIEALRQKYVDFGKSDIEQFAMDFAEGCRSKGSIDLTELDKRLNASEELFVIFGKKNGINMLIKDYAKTHAAMTEAQHDADVKDAFGKGIAETIQKPVTDASEITRLDGLHKTQKKEAEEALLAQDVQALISSAEGDALSPEDFAALSKRQAELSAQLHTGAKTKEQHALEADKAENKNKGLFSFGDKFGPEEADQQTAFRKALETLGLDQEAIDDLVKHEKLHFDAAKALDLHPEYAVQLVKKSDGTLEPHAITTYDDPKGTAEEVLQKLIAVKGAPGLDGLDDHDSASLGLTQADKQDASSIAEAIQKRDERLKQPPPSEPTKPAEPTEPDEPAQITPDGELDVDLDEIESSMTNEQKQALGTRLQDRANEALTREEYIQFNQEAKEIKPESEQLAEALAGAEDADKEIAQQAQQKLVEKANKLSGELRKGKETFDSPEDLVKALLLLNMPKDQIKEELAGIQRGLDIVREASGIPLYSVQLVKDGENNIALTEVRPKPKAA